MNTKNKIKMSKYNIGYLLEEVLGAGVSLNPIAFLVVQSNVVKLLPVNHSNTLDKILDYMPDLIEKANCMFNKSMQNKKDLNQSIVNTIKKRNENNNKQEIKEEEIKISNIKEKEQ